MSNHKWLANRGRRALWFNLLLVLITSPASVGFVVVNPSATTTTTRQHSAARLWSSTTSSSSELVNSSLTSSSQQENDDEEWWKSVKFQHASVAEETRKDFPILQERDVVYLDSAATSQKPKFVVDALAEYYHTQNSNVHRGAHLLSREATAAYEEARDVVASFIHANSRNEVVFTSGATQALNLIASSYARPNLKEGDEVIFSVMEHHSNIVPWQIVANETGAKLKHVELNQHGGLDLDHLSSLLNSKTKIVSLQHVSNVMGCINDVSQIVSMVRSKAPHAKIVLDACQSVPHKSVNVQELGVDFMAASGHKMCGPTGIGFLWGLEHLLNEMPPYMGGGEMILDVTLETSTFAPAPARFEAGTPPIAQAIGMAAAIKYLQNIGMDRIEAYEHEMADYLYKRLCELPLTVLGPSDHRAALCAFVSEKVHSSDLSSFLDMEGIAIRAGHHCCQPLHQYLGHSHTSRASLYFYNTKEDIDAFIEKLTKTLDFFENLQGSNDENGDEFVPFI